MAIKIRENSKAIIWKVNDYPGDFEVWMKLDDRKGGYIEPKDEDFGVWAWVSYTLFTAEKIFEEITTGKRTIRPMVDEP